MKGKKRARDDENADEWRRPVEKVSGRLTGLYFS